MTPERWRRVKSALSEAMALGDAARAAYLDGLGRTDPEMRTEVESLLAAEREAGSEFLETPAPAALDDAQLAESDAASAQLIGQRLGPYRLLAEIGAGGMGRVYRAVRADAEYQQEVAIKLVRASADAEFVAQRLRTERQILASLAHPNIGRLLDGGTTPEGVPYLVMELIDGEPITRYCEQQRLDVNARLELFLRVCAAVQYAHQRMVIHRDLKPSNILVTADGTPKLLDFGIAKILEPGAVPVRGDATINSLRVLTPDYASPEQVRGETVTAASDVYSLGVILYELLTGARPFHGGERAREADRATLDTAMRKPSTVVRPSARPSAGQNAGPSPGSNATIEGSPEKLSRRLRGDLDNIALMALRREPERRYGTVERLADDIRRHLEHLPITARKPTLGYRAATFVTRHRFATVATALVASALIGGIAMTLQEAHVAEAQRARADRRFNDVRRLAETLIFEVHDSIRDLPGAEKARRLLIDTAVRYLGSLSREAAGDPSLQHELAAAYIRLGDLQGRAREANEGDYAGARRSYGQAFTLLGASLAARPDDEDAQRDMIITCGKLSDLLLWSQNDTAAALWYSQQTEARSGRLSSQHPTDRSFRYFFATSLLDHGYKLFEIRGDTATALTEMLHSVAILESLHAADAGDVRTTRTLALGYSRTGEAMEYRHDYADAVPLYAKEHGLLVTLTRAAPQNADVAHLLAFAELDMAGAQANLGRFDEALQHGQAALDFFKSLAVSDPKIAEYRHDESHALVSIARIEGLQGRPQQAIALLQQAFPQMDAATTAADASDSDFDVDRAQAELLAGDDYAALASDASQGSSSRSRDWRQSRAHYEQSLTQYRKVSGTWFQAASNANQAAEKIRRCDAALAGST
jgi:eukaryotic-like serine/threonine-protein kinase